MQEFKLERIHVYQLPDQLTGGYCFDGGHSIPFLNVDWFDGQPNPEYRQNIIDFVKAKSYRKQGHRYLILGETFAEIV